MDTSTSQQAKFAFALQLLFHEFDAKVIDAIQDGGKDYLVNIWDHLSGEEGLDQRAFGLTCEFHNVGLSYPLVLIVLPPPERLPEAYMIALVCVEYERSKTGYMSFFYTLEHNSMSPTDTYFCAWDDNGTHLNFGTGPQPEVHEFLNVVSERLKFDLERLD